MISIIVFLRMLLSSVFQCPNPVMACVYDDSPLSTTSNGVTEPETDPMYQTLFKKYIEMRDWMFDVQSYEEECKFEARIMHEPIIKMDQIKAAKETSTRCYKMAAENLSAYCAEKGWECVI